MERVQYIWSTIRWPNSATLSHRLNAIPIRTQPYTPFARSHTLVYQSSLPPSSSALPPALLALMFTLVSQQAVALRGNHKALTQYEGFPRSIDLIARLSDVPWHITLKVQVEHPRGRVY